MTTVENWLEWAETGWSLSFRYPPTDRSGRSIIVDRRPLQPATSRVHVMAEDRDEIYFEVVRAPGVQAIDFHQTMQERLPTQYPDVSFTTLDSSGAWLCGSFSWADQMRRLCFTERSGSTYRVIYRPLSTVNRDIWETVELR